MHRSTDKYKVVLVEDSEDDVLLFDMTLKRSGLDQDFEIVARCDTGDAAIAYFREWQLDNPRLRPEIVILDINLPGRNGIEVMEWMWEQKERPIVAVFTTSQAPEEYERARALGAAMTQPKTFETDEFMRFMHSLGKLADDKRRQGAAKAN